jgi:hypothetical protein
MSRARWLLGATSHSAVGALTADGKKQPMHTLNDLRARGRMSWIDATLRTRLRPLVRRNR